MRALLHKVGKFYSGIVMKNIGIFIFIGFLSVIFMEGGWCPNENIYAISQLVYKTGLPLLIGYEAGKRVAEHPGGITAVMAVAGVITANDSIGILGAMIAAPAAAGGLKYIRKKMEKYIKSGTEMLAGNLLVGITGGIFAIICYYLAAPFFAVLEEGFSFGVEFLVHNRMIGLLSILIEPAKVLFLNNIINHGILFPLGMNQAEQAGQSILFLLEANPGPGLGVLSALFLMKKESWRECSSGMFVQFIGGIHEIYFPYVLSNLWLLLALIAGGMAGNFCFILLDAGTMAPISPGSIITIILLSGKGNAWKSVVGILVSMLVSCGAGILVLKIQQNGCRKETETELQEREEKAEQEEAMKLEEEIRKAPISQIGFVCDAGVGSSAMGAALLRRTMKQQLLEGIAVSAYASDQIPQGLDLLVCQKDYRKHIPEEFQTMEIYEVESLLDTGEFEALIQDIKRRNG